MGVSTAAIGAIATEPATSVESTSPLARMPARDLHASEHLKEALVQEEGVRDVVYRDVAGHPTVGVGHLVTPSDGLKVGDKVGYDRILDFLDEDLAEAEDAVTRVTGDMPLYQHEYDALVDLVYNVGEGNLSPDESPKLAQAIAMRDYDGIAQELDYRYAGGDMARGLAYRSERRTQMFTEASYEDPRNADGPGVSVPA